MEHDREVPSTIPFAPGRSSAPDAGGERVLAAVAYMAEELLKPGAWEARLQPAMARLGASLHAAKLHVLRCVSDERDRPAITCVAEWIRPDAAIRPCIHGEVVAWEDAGLDRWRQLLELGGSICGPVRDLPEPERSNIGHQGTQSVATLPIFVGDEWWGIVGLDECDSPRLWSTSDLECLATAARLIGNAIQRERSEAALASMAALERAIIDESPIGISVRDRTGRLLRCNAAWKRIWAKTDEEVLDDMTRVRDRLSLDERDSYLGAYAADVIRVYEEGGSCRVPEVPSLNDRPGAARWLSQTFYAIQDASGEVSRVVVLTEDATSRRQAEEEAQRLMQELQRSAQELETKVQERTAELKAINEELQAFTYSVSHDLRAPLRGLDGFSAALLEDYGDVLPPNGRRYAHLIRQSAREMGALIDRMLELSRLSRRAIEREWLAVNDVVREVVEELEPEIQGRDVRLHVGDLGSCWADAVLIRHVFANLISNAVKFTRDRVPAVIEVGKRDGAFYVKDNGAGFPMEYAHKLFKPFQRLHSAQEFPGTGVGLTIVKRIVTSHGGRVWAQGTEHEGACFYFTIGDPPATEMT